MDQNNPLEGLGPEGYVPQDTAKQTLPYKLAESAIDAFTLPHDVMQGEVNDHQLIERAANLAGFMIGGPAPIAESMADGTLGSFAGVRSKTFPWKKSMEYSDLEKAGADPDKLWKDTGLYVGPDNKIRYEIPDRTAKLKLENLDDLRTDAKPNWLTVVRDDGLAIKPVKSPTTGEELTNNLLEHGEVYKPWYLSDILDHPELYKAYPELRKVKIEPMSQEDAAQGLLGRQGGDVIQLAAMPEPKMKEVLLHEIQHRIQDIEGFAKGGTQGNFLPDNWNSLIQDMQKATDDFFEEATVKNNIPKPDIRRAARSIQAEQEGVSLNKYQKGDIDWAKEKEIYDPLMRIAKAQQLITYAETQAFEKYKALAGETEARNVMARMRYHDIINRRNSPARTADVPESKQIIKE